MWVVILVLVALTFIIAVAAQLEIFGLNITQLITFKRARNNDS